VIKCASVELAAATICTNRGEYLVFAAERDIVDFFIMSDKLSEHSLLLEIPDGAGGVN
jgi:hypothetical protein